jgi:hypothetical protein
MQQAYAHARSVRDASVIRPNHAPVSTGISSSLKYKTASFLGGSGHHPQPFSITVTMADTHDLQWGDELDNHPDGTICPFLTRLPGQSLASLAPASVRADGVYHGDGTRCPLWRFTRTQTQSSPGSTSDALPNASQVPEAMMAPASIPSPQGKRISESMVGEFEDSETSTTTPAVHPNLQRILHVLAAPNITSAWIADFLVPASTKAYGTSIAAARLADNVWPDTMKTADLFIQALARADSDAAFGRRYLKAMMRRGKKRMKAEGDRLEGQLADEGADFAIWLLMVLKSRGEGGLAMESVEYEGDGEDEETEN